MKERPLKLIFVKLPPHVPTLLDFLKIDQDHPPSCLTLPFKKRYKMDGQTDGQPDGKPDG